MALRPRLHPPFILPAFSLHPPCLPLFALQEYPSDLSQGPNSTSKRLSTSPTAATPTFTSSTAPSPTALLLVALAAATTRCALKMAARPPPPATPSSRLRSPSASLTSSISFSLSFRRQRSSSTGSRPYTPTPAPGPTSPSPPPLSCPTPKSPGPTSPSLVTPRPSPQRVTPDGKDSNSTASGPCSDIPGSSPPVPDSGTALSYMCTAEVLSELGVPVATWPAAPADPRVVAAAAAALGPLRDAVRMVGAPYAGWRDPLAATSAEGVLAGEGLEVARSSGVDGSCGLSGADLAVVGEAGALVARLMALVGLADGTGEVKEADLQQQQQGSQKEQANGVSNEDGAAKTEGNEGSDGAGAPTEGRWRSAAMSAAAQARALLLRALGPSHGRCAEAGLLEAVCLMAVAPPCGACSCNREGDGKVCSSSDGVVKVPGEQEGPACDAGEDGGSGCEDGNGTAANAGGAGSSIDTSSSSWDEAWELAKPALKLRQQVGWELG